MYDHGDARKNQIYYGQVRGLSCFPQWKNMIIQPSPPLYDFVSIRDVFIHIFYSSNDIIATAEDIENEMITTDLRKDVVQVRIFVVFGFVTWIFILNQISLNWWEISGNC